jgi:hypothetical protein
LTSTWQDREQRVLEVIRDAEEAGEEMNLDVLAERVTLDDDFIRNHRLVALTLRRLLDARFIDATVLAAGDDPMIAAHDVVLLERGLRAVQVWPSKDPYAALVAMLEERLETETEPEKRSRIRTFLDGAKGAGRDVGVDLIAAFLRQMAGLP